MPDRFEKSRERRRKFEAHATYEVWRNGGNPDAIDLDRIDAAYYAGDYPEEAADRKLRHQR